MFFGNMQSFYRRNSIHNQSSSHQSSIAKELSKRIKHSSKYKKEDDESTSKQTNRLHHANNNNSTPVRRSSFSISRNDDYDPPEQAYTRSNVPVIKIGMYEPDTSKKSFNILKEKEKALRYNTSTSSDDNRERLGPNKNNIIGETLENERRKSGDWGC